MMQDPLDQLFVKTEQIEGEQRAILAQLILPYASINADTGDVHFKTTFDDLSTKQKILLYLLCRLALSTRPNTTFTVAVSPVEVEKATMLPGGTVRPKLTELVKDRIIVKSGDGYSVPAVNLQRAKKMFSIEE
ncbi:MAG TPA: hypothetical protein VGA72_06160 [Anaerolineales bacterium]|jgi:hypothetical protein